MKIYTKVGDGGGTRLYGGKKTSKADPRVDAYGEVDELNSALGVALAQTAHADLTGRLDKLQMELFTLGADLATPPGTRTPKTVPRIGAAHVARLEKDIDTVQAVLMPQKHFLQPGGSPAAAALYLARAVCRRAERAVVVLAKKQKVDPQIQIYLNRLSDYLFVLARLTNRLDHKAETPWIPPAEPAVGD